MAVAVVQCVVTANAAPAGTSVTSSWTPAAGNQYLMFAGIRGGGAPSNFVTGVSGNGLTWVKIADVDDTQNVIAGTLWKGTGTPSAGAVTLTHGLDPISLSIQLIELSGADSTLGAVATANVGATDDNAPTVDLTTTGANSMVLGLIIGRSATLTVGSGYTAIQINQTASSSGNISRSSSEYKIVASPGLTTVNASLSSANDWAIIAVEVLEAATGINGTLTKTLGGVTVAGVGAVGIAATSGKTLGALTLVATVAVDSFGTLTKTLGGATVSAAGAVGISGSVAKTLAPMTASGAGAVATAGVTNQTLGALGLTAPGALVIAAALGKTLGALTAVAAGTVGISGAVVKTLGALTLTADGDLATGNQGTLSKTLGALTVVAAGTVANAGELDTGLGGATVSAAGAVAIMGSMGAMLGALTVTAAGEGPGVGGNVAGLLAPLEIEADGVLTLAATAGIMLDALTSAATAKIANTGAGAIVLGGLTLQTAGTLSNGPVAELHATLGGVSLIATGADLTVLAVVYGIVYGASKRGVVYGTKQRGTL